MKPAPVFALWPVAGGSLAGMRVNVAGRPQDTTVYELLADGRVEVYRFQEGAKGFYSFAGFTLT